MGSRRGLIGITTAIALGALAMSAAPAMAGVESGSKESHVNAFKDGKFKVRPVGFGPYTAVEVFNKSLFLRYEGDAKINDPDRIKGDFGKYGKVDLRFEKSGPFTDQKLPDGCDGTPNRKQKGTWKGVFKVKTEKSVVDVRKTKLPGSIVKIGKYDCPFEPGPTFVSLFGASDSLFFGARVRQSGGKPQFLSFTGERKGGADIFRGVAAKGKQSDFTYAPDYSTAEVSPPAPFSGTGTYTGGIVWKRGAMTTTGILDGNLKAKFLGLDGKLPITSDQASLGNEDNLRGAKRWTRTLRGGRWHR